MVMEKVNKEKEKAEHHLDLRRLVPPACPHMIPPGVSQKKEMGREECVGGGLAGSQQEHWLLLKQDGRRMMVQPGDLLCIYHLFDVECKLELTLTTDYSDFDDTKVSNLLHTDNSSIACARSRNYSLSLGPPKRWVCVVKQPCAGILKLGSMALKLGAGESGIRDKNVKWTH